MDWSDWMEEIVVMHDEANKPARYEGRVWNNFAVIPQAGEDALEEPCWLVHFASQTLLGCFADRKAAIQAALLLAAVGDWDAFRWPITREEVGLLWFRGGLFPLPDASQRRGLIWAASAPTWAVPAIPDLTVAPPNGDGA